MNRAAAAAPGITDLDIWRVAQALGLPIRGNRFQVNWRKGDSWSGSLNKNIGGWIDHKTGDKGGIIDLVRHALGVDKRGALEWLMLNFSIAAGGTYSATERREFAGRRAAARATAEVLAERRDAYILDLQVAMGLLLERFHFLRTLADALQDTDVLVRAEECFTKLDELSERRLWLAAATGPQLAAFFTEIAEVAS